MRFSNREDAARLLAEPLQRFARSQPLVLGIPRGGAPIAKIVADRLGCDFEVVLVRKLCSAEQPELAMGAVDEAGRVYHYGAKAATNRDLYPGDVAGQVMEMRRRRQLYSQASPPISPAGQTAVVVDDGIATGATMVAAIRAVRACRPLRVVVGVPVASRGAMDLARSYADEVVCLHCPRMFYAVGDFYDDFTPVADSDVVALLDARRGPGTARP
jgi:putative phosphoribosyl transferase